MGEVERKIPRKLWMLWYQGLDRAPFVVQKCVESWKKENPDWEIMVLDDTNIKDYITLDLPPEKADKLPLTKLSNLARLQLIHDYGGVWADATTLCMKPLREWIEEASVSGFFAFSDPGRDRPLGTWFLASQPRSLIVKRWANDYAAFFANHTFNEKGIFKKKIYEYLLRMLNRSRQTTKYWFSPLITKVLKVYPYYIFHYTFDRLISRDSESREIWNDTPKISAVPVLRFGRRDLLSPLDGEAKMEVDERRIPLYKLSFKYDHNRYSASSALYYLLEGRHEEETD